MGQRIVYPIGELHHVYGIAHALRVFDFSVVERTVKSATKRSSVKAVSWRRAQLRQICRRRDCEPAHQSWGAGLPRIAGRGHGR